MILPPAPALKERLQPVSLQPASLQGINLQPASLQPATPTAMICKRAQLT